MALAFVVLAPFFSQISNANVEPDSVPPETQEERFGTCQIETGAVDGVDAGACQSLLNGHYKSLFGSEASVGYTETYRDATAVVWNVLIEWVDTSDRDRAMTIVNQQINGIGTVISKFCPNSGYPNYVYGRDTDGDGQVDECLKENPALEKCENGNYKYKVNGACIPVNCASSGTQSDFWASGSVYGNTTGTYCDGACAQSVSGGQNDDSYQGSIAITGVATGEVCGGGSPNDRWHNEGNGDNCEVLDGFLTCTNESDGTDVTPVEPEPTIDLDTETVTLAEMQDLIPNEEICATGDSSCEIRNLKETILSKGLEQKEIDKILHNKNISADEKTTKKIVDGITDSSGRNLQGLQMITASINGLKDSLLSEGGGGAVGGTGTGDGFGDGDVTCDGDDCEGGILTDIEPTAGLVGYWETEYENGLQGIMDEKLIDVKDTEFFGFLEQFNPSISGGAAANYQMCFNIGSLGNFGCHNFDIDPRVFPAIRIFILVTAGFLCRKILFGG